MSHWREGSPALFFSLRLAAFDMIGDVQEKKPKAQP
jgi:hypothetical protein